MRRPPHGLGLDEKACSRFRFPGLRAALARLQHAAASVRHAYERGDAHSLRLDGGELQRASPVRGRLHPRRGAGAGGAAAGRGGVGHHHAHAPRADGGEQVVLLVRGYLKTESR